jgi:hypothetical protein
VRAGRSSSPPHLEPEFRRRCLCVAALLRRPRHVVGLAGDVRQQIYLFSTVFYDDESTLKRALILLSTPCIASSLEMWPCKHEVAILFPPLLENATCHLHALLLGVIRS